MNETSRNSSIDVDTMIALAKLEERVKTSENRIVELQENSKNIMDVMVSVQKVADAVTSLANKQEDMTRQQADMNERLGELENVPASRWKTMSTTIFTSLITLLATTVGAAIIAILVERLSVG